MAGDEMERASISSFYRIFVKRRHTITLLCLSATSIFVLEYLNRTRFQMDSVLAGILAAILMFLTFAVCCFPDDAFVRPSPAFWRVVLGVTILYLMMTVFAYFQDVESLRAMLKYVDPSLGHPLAEKSYASDCQLFNWNHPSGPLGPLWEAMDFFVLAHSLGWMIKFMILRDWTLCWVLSIGFELCELTFRHILPNFWECWWDHLLLDLFGCNLLGMIMGWGLCKLFDMMKYDNWSCVYPEGPQEKKVGLKAAVYDVQTWTCWLAIIYLTLAFDVNYFFIKAILWLEPNHWMVFVRGVPIMLAAAHTLRQMYDYVNDPERASVGVQLWIFAALMVAEILFVFKNYESLKPINNLRHTIDFVQPWYSKAIVAFFAVVTVGGYCVAGYNQWSRAHHVSADKKSN